MIIAKLMRLLIVIILRRSDDFWRSNEVEIPQLQTGYMELNIGLAGVLINIRNAFIAQRSIRQ